MSAYYGAKFADLWGGTQVDAMQAIWAEELAGMTGEDIGRGLAGCKTKPWPPTLPEFILLCKPPINVDAALYEAIEQMRKRQTKEDSWSNPKIFWAAVSVGEFDIMNQSFASLRPRFATALEKAKDDPIPPRFERLPCPSKTQIAPEMAKRVTEGLLKTMKDCQATNLGWAHRIMERYERGEKINIYPLSCAREALGLNNERSAA